MATSVSRLNRLGKKLDKVRPLTMINDNTFLDTAEEVISLAEWVATNLSNGNYDSALRGNIRHLSSELKRYGLKLETLFRDQLDRNFVAFRDASRDDKLDLLSRRILLQLIEMRAARWNDDNSLYYKNKTGNETDLVTTTEAEFSTLSTMPRAPLGPAPQNLILGPGEVVKSSGKYPAPTRVVGKNYCKDEVVIRNADSGKVMGIKGRRVHMIEELSETVISFQRVNPGAKERLVQITGPTEEKINFAKQLVEDTIRRNASPVRTEQDSERPVSNNSDDDLSLHHQTVGSKLSHSFSTNDATMNDYKYTVTVGEESIKITGTNLDLVRTAKLVLDAYFSPDAENDQEEEVLFDHIAPFPGSLGDPAISQSSNIDNGNKSVVETSVSVEPTILEGVRHYTPEEIISYLDSPFSRKTPELDCPEIVRKSPIEWYTAAKILGNRNFKRQGSYSPSSLLSI